MQTFIVGAPRSGTTWVQLLLAQHPDVATAQETHLFTRYLAALWDGWKRERRPEVKRDLGISELMSTDEFLGQCREFSDAVLDRIAARSPGATTIVEKTPGHVLQAALIRELYPDAKFVHVLRDPRAVVASMRRAGQGWGAWWAPTGIITCAETWLKHVSAGLSVSNDPRWLTVRYEDLIEDCPDALGRIFDFLDLESGSSFCDEACRRCQIDRLQEGISPSDMPWNLEHEPDGFFGSGKVDSWRHELTSSEVGRIEYVTSEMMERLGYLSDNRGGIRPPTLIFRGGLAAFRRYLDRVLGGMIRRL